MYTLPILTYPCCLPEQPLESVVRFGASVAGGKEGWAAWMGSEERVNWVRCSAEGVSAPSPLPGILLSSNPLTDPQPPLLTPS